MRVTLPAGAILRAAAFFLAVPLLAVVLGLTRDPDLDDVLVVVLAYITIPYWLVTVPWCVVSAWGGWRMGRWSRAAWICAAPAVAYTNVWWGSVGFALALVVIGVFGNRVVGPRRQ